MQFFLKKLYSNILLSFLFLWNIVVISFPFIQVQWFFSFTQKNTRYIDFINAKLFFEFFYKMLSMTVQSKALMDIDNAYSFISHQVAYFTQAFHWHQVDWIKSVGKQLRNMWAGTFIWKSLLKNILEFKSIIIKKWQMFQ